MNKLRVVHWIYLAIGLISTQANSIFPGNELKLRILGLLPIVTYFSRGRNVQLSFLNSNHENAG